MGNMRLLVDPATLPPFAPSSHGLLSVATPATPDNPHWQNGITYLSRCLTTDAATTYDECITVTGTGGAPPAPAAKADNVDYPVLRGATAFTVFAEFDCSPVGVSDALRVATDSLAQSEPWQVERAFWTGNAAGQPVVFPHLAANAQILDASDVMLQSAAVTGGGPFDIAEALGVLEQELANCYDGVGVIHVPRVALPTLDAWGLVRTNGPVLKTLNGNLVAAGAGYTGSSPSGQARPAGQSWLYATGQVFVYRGAVRAFTPRESIDRGNNTRKMIAERTYLFGWDCCHAAVLANLGVPT